MTQWRQEVNQRLSELFVGHNIDCTMESDCITFPQATALKLWGDLAKASSDKTATLDVYLALGDGRTVVESFVGFASPSQSAEHNALQYFCRADFHVLLSTFFGSSCHDDQVDKEEWNIAETKRQVVCGNMIPRQLGDNELSHEWYQSFEALVHTAQLDNRVHWLRLFYAHDKGHSIAHELLLDNEPWEPHETEVLNWTWTKSPSFYSVRMFMTILPFEETAA